MNKYLTRREEEVLGLLAQGLANGAIAEIMSLSSKSIENYINTIYCKMDLRLDKKYHSRVISVLMWQDAVKSNGGFFINPGGFRSTTLKYFTLTL